MTPPALGPEIEWVDDQQSEWILDINENGAWELRSMSGGRLRIDFDEPGPDYHRKIPRGRQELVARALGSKHGVRRLLDLSAGLGQDAVSFCQLGFSVIALERHPLLAFLLQEAKARSQRSELANLSFQNADAREVLQNPEALNGIEALYFDPMYPEKKKSALPRQEMVLFRQLVGPDGDAAEVLQLALKSPVPRTVVKRPSSAPALLPGVTHSFEGKTVRYDLYVRS